jgi:hypothetical protein
MSETPQPMTLLAKEALVPVFPDGTECDYLGEFMQLPMFHRECGLGRIRCRYYPGRDDLFWLEFFCTHCLEVRKIALITALNTVKRFLTTSDRAELQLESVTLQLVENLP